MKKTMLVLIALLAIGGAVFGQSFTVQSVSGRVERETGGKWAAVNAGDTLTGEAVIRSGIGARLVLASDGRTFSVGRCRPGLSLPWPEAGRAYGLTGRSKPIRAR
ncbi:MAG: hypothetical protein LBE17_10725 [Treponema sp.]|jgi:hypothetical protein|nr:hypothetical protein [Treponema sp.]